MEEAIIATLKKAEELVSKANLKTEFVSAAFNDTFKLLWSLNQKQNVIEDSKSVPISAGRERGNNEALVYIARELGMEVEFVKNIYYLDEHKRIQLTKLKIPGKGNAEKQTNLALLILYPNKLAEKEWLDTEELTSKAKEMGVFDTHLSRNIQTRRYFSIKGKGKGCQYRLTTDGEEAARELINNILKRE